MKKLILSALAGIVLCAAAFTGYKVYENQTASSLGDLMKLNIEALTGAPGGNGNDIIEISCNMGCWHNNKYNCSFNYNIPLNSVQEDPEMLVIPMDCPLMAAKPGYLL